MKSYGCSVFCLIALAFLLSGCGEKGPYRKPTFPVKGLITVDGAAPDSPIKIECTPLSEIDTDPKHYSVSLTMSKPGGAFEIATYESGDGVPEGEYVLTFFWGTFNVVNRSYVGPDKLKNRYSDPKKSEIKFTVAGKAVELGEIALQTKP